MYVLRSLAVILILYDHLVPGSYYMAGLQPPITVVDEYIIWPLAITNYFGAFGVDIFFLISGFAILCSTEQRKTTVGVFLLRRMVRIILPLLFSFVLFMVLFYSSGNYLRGMTIFDPVLAYISANGALWTLKVEIWFYLLFALLLPAFRKHMVCGTFLFLIVTIAVCQIGSVYQPLFELCRMFSYMFYILAGMATYLIWSEKCNLVIGGGFIGAIWFGIVHYNIQIFNPERYSTGNSFGVSALYAILIFWIFLLAEDRLKCHSLIKKVSQYSFGLYLHHMPFQSLIFPWVHGEIHILIILTLCLSILATKIQIRFIEIPSAKFLKIMIGKYKISTNA